MGIIDLSVHLLSFAAPAFAVALLVTLAAPLLLPRGRPRLGAWARFGLSFAAGLGALLAGLWFFGRDGKMASYTALVIAVATTQWFSARGWRS